MTGKRKTEDIARPPSPACGGLVQRDNLADARSRDMRLNDKGNALHDRILKVALEREERLIAGADPADLEAFLRVMRIMRDNVDEISVSTKA